MAGGGAYNQWGSSSWSAEAPPLQDRLLNPSQRARFEEEVVPRLDAAYNLPRSLTGNDHDADDGVQQA